MSTIKALVVLSLCAALVASANVARREEEEEQEQQQEQQEQQQEQQEQQEQQWGEEPEDAEGEIYLCGSPSSKNQCDFYSQYPAPVYVDEVEETEDQEKVEGYWTNPRQSKYMCQAVTIGECTVIGSWLLGEWKSLAYGVDTWNMYDIAGNEATVPTTYTTLNEETGAYKTVVFNSYAQCEQWLECNPQDEADKEDEKEEDKDVKEECVPGYSGDDEDDKDCNQEGQGNEDRNEQNMWEQPEEDEKELEKKAECNLARYIKQTTTTYDEPVGTIVFSEINTCHSGLTGEFTFTAEGDRYTGELEATGDIALCSNFRCSRQLNIINDSTEHISTKAPRSTTTKKTSVSTDLESTTSSQMGAGAGAAVGVAVTLVAVFVGAAIAHKRGAFAGITNRQYEVITEH